MKIRQGFVSNSSSSSFVIALEKKPKTVGELVDAMFPDGACVTYEYWDNSDQANDFNPYSIASTVFRDIKDQEPMTREQVVEQLSCGWLEGEPERDWSEYYKLDTMEARRHVWDEEERIRKEYAQQVADGFLSSFGHRQMFHVEYSDNDGAFMAAMEHAGIFINIPHVRVSHH